MKGEGSRTEEKRRQDEEKRKRTEQKRQIGSNEVSERQRSQSNRICSSIRDSTISRPIMSCYSTAKNKIPRYDQTLHNIT